MAIDNRQYIRMSRTTDKKLRKHTEWTNDKLILEANLS